jgi:hypothetical protein
MKKNNKFNYSDNDIEFFNRNNRNSKSNINLSQKNNIKKSNMYDIKNKSKSSDQLFKNKNIITPKRKIINDDNTDMKDILYYLSFYDQDWWRLI